MNIENNQRFKQKEKKSEVITLGQSDLEAVAILYDNLREAIRENHPEADKDMADQFDDHVKNVMVDLSGKLKPNLPDYVVNTHIIRAKYALYEICFSKYIEYMGSLDPKLGAIIEGIHDAHALIFKDTTNLIFSTIDRLKKDQDIPNTTNIETGEKVRILQRKNEELLANQEEMRIEILSLQEENKKYLDTIIKHSKGERRQPSISEVNGPKFQDQTRENEKRYNSPLKENANRVEGEKNSYNRQNPNVGNPQNLSSNNANLNQSHNNSFGNSSGIQNGVGNTNVIGPTVVRTLTLKQLKDMIEEIYNSKQKYDKKYLEAKLPRETLEQHMYTFLNQKYGLKNLMIEWATAIINGIRKFSCEDNDVAVFGQILKNECDEEFRFVQSQVKNTIVELLKMYLRGRYPFKHNAEINDILQTKTNGWIYEEECSDIIMYMYNQEDANQILEKLKGMYVTNNKTNTEGKKLSREEQIQMQMEKDKPKIEFSTFQKVILDFQLKSHQKFLKNFLLIFKQIDTDNNGILNEGEFRSLVSRMGIGQDEANINRLLQTVDPYRHELITFSQTVTLFSSELITQGTTKLSVLQKLSLKG